MPEEWSLLHICSGIGYIPKNPGRSMVIDFCAVLSAVFVKCGALPDGGSAFMFVF